MRLNCWMAAAAEEHSCCRYDYSQAALIVPASDDRTRINTSGTYSRRKSTHQALRAYSPLAGAEAADLREVQFALRGGRGKERGAAGRPAGLERARRCHRSRPRAPAEHNMATAPTHGSVLLVATFITNHQSLPRVGNAKRKPGNLFLFAGAEYTDKKNCTTGGTGTTKQVSTICACGCA